MNTSHLTDNLEHLKLSYFQCEHRELTEKAAREAMAHGDYLDRLVEG
jgi:hypothetical protein